MPPPELPLELLLIIAHLLLDDFTDNNDGLSLDALKSFRQVNRTLCNSIDPMFWREALKRLHTTQRVFTSLISRNDLSRLTFFLDLGISTETRLPEFGDIYANYGFYKAPTPLIAAAYLDNIPLAGLLLVNGAGVETALHSARSAAMAQLLLDFRADPEAKTLRGLTPLHFYAQNLGSIGAMRAVLQRGVEVDPATGCVPWGWHSTPLHGAAYCGNIEAVKLLLEFGADVRKKDLHGNSPLHLAAKAGEIEVVRFLVERWPEAIKAKNEAWQTPLHWAVLLGRTEVVKLLVDSWPEGIRVEDRDGNTLLHCVAAGQGNTKTMRLLVEHWPEGIMAENKRSDTPLDVATAAGRTEMLKVLVGCCPEGMMAKNEAGQTPK
jgi:ankyrin repeat protein